MTICAMTIVAPNNNKKATSEDARIVRIALMGGFLSLGFLGRRSRAGTIPGFLAPDFSTTRT
jgi:hypothetical protein